MKTLGAIAKAIMEAVGRSAKTEAPYVALLKHTRAKDSTRPAITQVSARQKPMAASVLLGALFQGPPFPDPVSPPSLYAWLMVARRMRTPKIHGPYARYGTLH
jgi:hypothetical protein